ncbi:lysine-specific demethylase 9-like [Ischnura elegans]|uniref:lysine-specific demethylase 9-like n=1 Tax=Ischnura elegans TaxID=197161 RepID=UPI001ED87031|nr:lysine-specific demethylase 9-like [Ischnura elegans]XP_046406368.1 lysine-specific demethylase 9-like [Ischnura elegans]
MFALGPSGAVVFATLLIASSSVLQGYAESISRMQNTKPSEINGITPSPMVDWTMSTNGWRPMISPSVAPAEPEPTKEFNDPPPAAVPQNKPHRVPPTNGPPKAQPMASRPPPPKAYAAKPLHSSHHPSIDLTTYVDDADEILRPRPRRQKKRPPFKTVDPGSSLGLIASSPSDTIIAFRGASSDSPFIRHVLVTEQPFSRHRIRGHSPPAPLFQADPSQEMLPPTTSPQSSRPSFDSHSHHRGRPLHEVHHHHHQQGAFHGPSFYFQAPPPHSSAVTHQHHHQVHQQTPPPPPHAYPAVARPAEPLPGSLLRPHKDRLTDSSAFRTGGVGYQSRPNPVQWPDSLGDGRVHFPVTSTPLVEERPPHWDESVGGRQEGKVGEKPVKPAAPQRGKPQGAPENGKVKTKPHREQSHGHQLANIPVEEDQIWGGVGGASAELHGPTKDPTEASAIKTNGFDLVPQSPRPPKKPLRGSGEGKRQRPGTREGGQNFRQRPQENEESRPIAAENPREERPRPSKTRNNPNHRKKIENNEHSVKAEAVIAHQVPVVMHVKAIPTEEVIKGVRGESGPQRPQGVRKRRPKPNANREHLKTKRPVEAQEGHQQQEEQYQPAQQYQPQQQQNIQQQEEYQTAQNYRQQIPQQPEQYQTVQQYTQQQQLTPQRHPQEAEAEVDQYRQQVLDQVAQPQQQDLAEPPTRQPEQAERLPESQPTEGQRPRKRGRRPSRIRKPQLDTRTKVDGENQLAPMAVQAEEQQPAKWTASRPRPILRTRRPKPELQPTVEPSGSGETAPASSEGERDHQQPSGIGQVAPTAPTREETTLFAPTGTGSSYQVTEVQEDTEYTHAQLPQVPSSVESYHQEQGQLAEDPTGFPPQNAQQNENIPSTAEGYGITTVAEEEANVIPPTSPTRVRPQRLPDPSTTLEAATTTSTEASTTTVRPTSSAFGIRSRIRTGTRPRFSVKDYRERLNRLSQLSGHGRNGTDEGETAEGTTADREPTATGAGTTGPGRERWYPGRRKQQTLQEQQQMQHQRLQASSTRNDGQEVKEEKSRVESVRDRYRPRPPALRQRPTAAADTTAQGSTAPGTDKSEETTTVSSSGNRYRSRYRGRHTTTTVASSAEGEVTTTENPTSRRRGILTTYGMRRPLPLRVRPGQTTTTEALAESSTTPMTTTDFFEETSTAAYAAVTSTTEAAATSTTTEALSTTSPSPPTTTDTPPAAENEVNEAVDVSVSSSEEEEEDGIDLKQDFIQPGQLVNVGSPVSLSVLTESGSEEDEEEISPEQRVSDLTVWATTGQTGGAAAGGAKGSGRGGDGGAGGLVTFSALPSSYPAIPYSPRLVTMATEDPVLPLEAFFFGPSASGGKSPSRAR